MVAPLFVADAPARADVLNMQHRMGDCGCNLCEIKTRNCKVTEGKRSHRVYLYPRNAVQLRTHQSIQKQGQEALKLNKPVKGIKGICVLSILPELDLSTCLVPECMHSIFLGIVKRFMVLWFIKNPKIGLKKRITDIDNILLGIKPPNTFKRLPRSVTECKKYKATEFYNWLLFYSIPILYEFLEEKYFQHWLVLVISVYTLLKKEINQNEATKVEELLNLFVKNVERLYGDKEMTYNLHQLLHLPLYVKRWGPLWATSAFSFESFNGKISTFIHGTKNVGKEIVENLKAIEGIQILRQKLNGLKNVSSSTDNEQMKLIGKSIKINFTDFERYVLLNGTFDLNKLQIYKRAKVKNQIFTSLLYKNVKSNTYTVSVTMNDGSEIKGFIKFYFASENNQYIFLNVFRVEHDKIFTHKETQTSVEHILPIAEEYRPLIIQINDIKCINTLIKVRNFVCTRPNLLNKII